MGDQEWILQHLKICGYDVGDINYLGAELIGRDCEKLYSVNLKFFGEQVERIVFRHGKCLDMISKNIQVKDMLGNNDKVFFPRSNEKEVELAERRPIYMRGQLTPDTVLFFEDYASIREHFFEENHLHQVVCLVRDDESSTSINFGKYGRFKVTVMIGGGEKV